MTDPFAAPEGLRNVPLGLWPSPADQRVDCGHDVDEGDLIGRLDGDLGCEDCVTDSWDAADRSTHGYWGAD